MKKRIVGVMALIGLVFNGCNKAVDLENVNNQPQSIITSNLNQISYDPLLDICDQFNSLPSDSYFELEANATIDVECDIILENKSNIVIEGNGATLKYLDALNTGLKIQLVNCNQITLRNFKIDNNNKKASYVLNGPHTGRIVVKQSEEIEINNLEINKQAIYGNIHGPVHQIYFHESIGSTVKNCNIKASDGELIMLMASEGCLVEGNTLNKGWSGVGTSGMSKNGIEKYGYNNKIIDNIIFNSQTAFITVNDRNALVEGNYIEYNDLNSSHGPGIRFGHEQEYQRASNGICRNNTIVKLNNPGSNYVGAGIKVDYSQTNESNQTYADLLIDNNTIIHCNKGVMVSNQEGQYVHIKNNNITSIGLALDIFSGVNPDQKAPQNCLIHSNQFTSNSEVIKVFNSSVDISDNSILSHGVYNQSKAILISDMYTSPYTNTFKLKDNTINLNSNLGVYYKGLGLHDAIIEGNEIRNGFIGINFGGHNSLIKSNIIKNCSYRSVYIRDGSQNTKILMNEIYNPFQCSIYLNSTNGTLINGNSLAFTGTGVYSYAIWKNSTSTNTNINVFGNTLSGFTNESN